MGTIIDLEIHGISIDWSKNSVGQDHGHLFQESDRCRRKSEQINYEYYEEHPEENISLAEEAFARPLYRVLPRLSMLGYSIEKARSEYNEVVKEAKELDELSDKKSIPYLSFEEFCSFISRYPLSNLQENISIGDYDSSTSCFMKESEVIARIPQTEDNDAFWSEKSHFGVITCILSPYSMLQVFGTVPNNKDVEVIWQYGPLVDSGWATKEDFQAGARRGETILIATEGTSDARILQKAFNLLNDNVSDFFRFIDVNERHPFSGTGNLLKFAEGLVSIDVHNQVLFLLDNDAEGVDTLNKINALRMPSNMRAMTLPNHHSFDRFPCFGPEGLNLANINGRAAAIECYLDLKFGASQEAKVVWSNYKKDLNTWQGALEHKEVHMRNFLNLSPSSVDDYDLSKISLVLSSLIAESILIACK